MIFPDYAVVAGHNAIIPGAAGSGYKEHQVAREVTSRVVKYLKQLGAKAFDCTDNVGNTRTSVWSNAVKNTNSAIGSDGLAVSIHLNAGGGTGTEVLHYDSPELAAKVSAAVATVLGVRDRGPKDGKSIGYINSTNAKTILIELCFIDSAEDMKKLMSKLEEVAKVIAETITGKKLESEVVPVAPEPTPEPRKLPAGVIGQVRVTVDNLFAVVSANAASDKIEVVKLEKGRIYNVTANIEDYHCLILDDNVKAFVRGDNGKNLELIR